MVLFQKERRVNFVEEKEFKNVTNDLCFKYVFSNKHILKDFIDAFLDYIKLDTRFNFTDIGIQEYIMPHNKTYIGYLGDIVATLDNGTIISLECYSNRFTKSNYNKSYAYMCRLFDNNIEDSIEYKAKKIISLNLMKGNFRRINTNIVNKHHMTCENNAKESDEGNTIMYLVRIDKARNIQYTKDERFIRWLKLINTTNLEEMEKIGKDDEVMEEAIEFVKKWNNKTPEENLANYVKDKEKMARSDGFEEGSKIQTIEIAKNMLIDEVSPKTILKYTGLSKQELNKLKMEL